MFAETLRLLRSLVPLALTLIATNFSFAQSLPWMNPLLPPAQRAAMLVAAMTLDQKIEQIHGQPGPIPEVPSCGNGGRHVPGIPQLQVPTFRITNGPVGIGAGDCSPQAQRQCAFTLDVIDAMTPDAFLNDSRSGPWMS